MRGYGGGIMLATGVALLAVGCATVDEETLRPDARDVPMEWDAVQDPPVDGSDPQADEEAPPADLPVDAPDVFDLPADTPPDAVPDPGEDVPAEDAPVDPAGDEPAPDPDAVDSADASDSVDAAEGDTGSCDPTAWRGYDAADTPISIPDSDAAGVTSWIDVGDCDMEVWDVRVTVNIQHTWIGDLRVMLLSPNGRTVILHDQSGGSASDIMTTYPTLTDPYETLCKVTRQSSLGQWGLRVSDHAWDDTGQLVSWRLELSGTSGGCRTDWWYSLDSFPMAIPDMDTTGIASTIQVTDSGAITALRVGVDISHTWIGDLVVSVTSPSGTTVLLHDRSGGSSSDIDTFYPVPTTPAESLDVLLGTERMGTWTLRVSDHEGMDAGELNDWILEVN